MNTTSFDRGLVDVSNSKRPEDGFTNEAVIQRLAWLERCIHGLARAGLPQHAVHLAGEVKAVSAKLVRGIRDLDEIREFSGLSLKLIDTIPLYDREDGAAVHIAIDAKTICALVWMRRDMRWFFVSKWWREVRREIAETAPQVLGLGSTEQDEGGAQKAGR